MTTGEVSWSAEHFRIFGLDPDATTPSYAVFADRIHPEDRPAFEDMLEKAVRDGSDFQYGFRIVTPDGATKYLHSLGHLTANGAKHTEFIGTVMDVTERRLAEEALRSAVADLERASRLSTMGQLTASIAHEINQPLAAIITNADACLLWLEADRPNLEEARQAATRIVRNGHRAARYHQEHQDPDAEVGARDGLTRYQRRDPGGDRSSRARSSAAMASGSKPRCPPISSPSLAIGSSFSRSC